MARLFQTLSCMAVLSVLGCTPNPARIDCHRTLEPINLIREGQSAPATAKRGDVARAENDELVDDE
jgi:hypothetical protein